MYFHRLRNNFTVFRPDIVYYNAGTDILVGDPLGHMDISSEAVIQRDEMVISRCVQDGVSVVMVTSGGYVKPLSAHTIGNSLLSLHEKGLLTRFHVET